MLTARQDQSLRTGLGTACRDVRFRQWSGLGMWARVGRSTRSRGVCLVSAGLVMRATRELLVVSVDLGEQVCLDGVHGALAVDRPPGPDGRSLRLARALGGLDWAAAALLTHAGRTHAGRGDDRSEACLPRSSPFRYS